MWMRAEKGFTYLMLLWWLAIVGVVLAAFGERWSIESRRQKELELVFRGEQIKSALLSYWHATPGAVKKFPTNLEDLLQDQRDLTVKRHLRKLWSDPISGEPEWGMIRDGDFIVGVYSSSNKMPLNPPLSEIKSYQEWQFLVYSISPK